MRQPSAAWLRGSTKLVTLCVVSLVAYEDEQLTVTNYLCCLAGSIDLVDAFAIRSLEGEIDTVIIPWAPAIIRANSIYIDVIGCVWFKIYQLIPLEIRNRYIYVIGIGRPLIN